MAAKEAQKLAPCITCHSWNADGTKVAICPNDNEIHIYAKVGNAFKLEHKLTEHDQVVTGIDWAPKSNRIVSCSHDRNAYVWTFQNNKWKPTLVILRINRAATHVKWSPDENKFAVGCGQKCVSVCYFEEDNDWWVSKHIKKHKSTVLKIDWHPNNVLLATASSDFKCRIFGAHIKGVDKSLPKTPFGDKIPFGEPLLEIECGGWVQSVKWSPSGNLLAFASQDSALQVANVSTGQANTSTVKFEDLPLQDIVFLNEGTVVGAGFDNTPILFSNQGGWKLVKKLDTGSGAAAQGGAQKSGTAFDVFKNKVDRAESVSETKINTKHQNAITNLQKYGNGGYSSSGLDGQLIIWDAPK
jgi:actin related protein 2/3 complex subunit 1A/1B